MGLAEELRVKRAEWRHQEAMVYKGAALTAAVGSVAAALVADEPRKMAASGLALVFAQRLYEEAERRKAEAEQILASIQGGYPVARRVGWRKFLRDPIGQMAVAGAVIATIRLILWLLGYKW